MHPKTEIAPDSGAIERILAAGWVGQVKIHGHRAQIHIPANPDHSVIAYNRQGQRHKLELSNSILEELYRLFRPKTAWNVIDAEWLKPAEKLFVFDFLKLEGRLLSLTTYPERYQLLPRSFISPHLIVLPLLKDLPACMKVISQATAHTEGLVFKSTTSAGFSDTSIVRCRRRK